MTARGSGKAKRIFDLALLALLAPVAVPLVAVVAAVVRLKLGAPVFFTQERPGYKGECFRLWKFRSMTDARDAAGVLLPDAQRLPSFGRFLRSTSLDELPCLWNVLRGELSFVGPRPLLKDYLPLYSPEQRRRHDVMPGITGWAQVNGRNALTWDKKFALDLWYVDHRSLWLDVRVLFMTAKKVLVREGINQDGEATMARFDGR